MAIARRTAPRYVEPAHLGALGLPPEVLRAIKPYVDIVTRTGSGSGTVAPGGFPAGIYALRVRVSTAGALGVAAVEVSLDGGATYGAALAVPTNGALAVPGTSSSIASGLTLQLAGTFTLADVYVCDVASNVELNLDAASDWIDGYLRRRYTLPLTAWKLDLRDACAAHAALKILTVRGFDPEDPADKAVVKASADATTWADNVAKGWIDPGVTDSSDEEQAVDVVVASSPRRGWR